jgi:hypothetical protein
MAAVGTEKNGFGRQNQAPQKGWLSSGRS